MHVGEKERQAIKRLYRKNKNISLCARVFSRSRTTISKVLKSRAVAPKKKPRMTPARRKRALLAKKVARRCVKRGDRVVPQFPSARSIAVQLQREFGVTVSRRRVAEDLVAVGGKVKVRRKIPTRNLSHLKKRMLWCRRNIGGDTKRWLFSDETWVTGNEATSRTMWTFDGSPALPREFKSRFNIDSCMVWFAFGHDFKTELVIFPQKMNRLGETKNFRLDGNGYIRRCLSKVSAHLKATGRVLIQDGARSHVCRQVRGYAKRMGIKLSFDWPPYSPVLNVAEEVNAVFKRKVAEHHPSSMDELVSACHAAWAAIPQRMLNNFVKSFQTKLKKYSKAGEV